VATAWTLPSVTDIILSILDLISATTLKIGCSECSRAASSLSPTWAGPIKFHRELSFDGVIRAAERSEEFSNADVVRHIFHTRGLNHSFSTTGCLAVHLLLVLLRTPGLTVPTWLLRQTQSWPWSSIALEPWVHFRNSENFLMLDVQLGFMSPGGQTNFAVKDVINAMKFINTVAPSFGGSSTITLAGQSSGATLIRALLAAPSANMLFKSAILHSDPMVLSHLLVVDSSLIHNCRTMDSYLFLLSNNFKAITILSSNVPRRIRHVGIP
jgi:hypothetical protein